jgi:hypothetical protein
MVWFETTQRHMSTLIANSKQTSRNAGSVACVGVSKLAKSKGLKRSA